MYSEKTEENSTQNNNDRWQKKYICQLLGEYDIETTEDIQDALKDLWGGTIKETGRVLMCPVAPTTSLFESTNTMAAKAAAKSSNTFGK